MLRKRIHHTVKISPLCGEIIEILSSRDYPKIDIAMVIDIMPTQAHFHRGFEEIYFVMDGSITIGLYDPKENKFSQTYLEANELLVIGPDIHHKVIAASSKNRLCVICLPGFDPNDEHLSEKF
jgi:mannose-6-phosphate isomerase-like protein (cupin superfamily)